MGGFFIAAPFALLMLAACQTDDTLAIDDVEPSRDVEIHGDGATAIALLVPRSASGAQGIAAQARIDGARLALDELGAGALSLRIYDTGTSASGAGAAGVSARGDGVVLAAGTGTVSQAAAAGASLDEGGAPLIAFVSGTTGATSSVFPFISDSVDGLLEGVRLTTANAGSRFVIIHPRNHSASDLARLNSGIAARGGGVAGLVAYPERASAIASALKRQEDVLNAADVALVVGEEARAAFVLDVLAEGEVGSDLSAVIGEPGWSETIFARPSAQGVLIAREPPAQLDLIAERYQARFGRPPTRDAALAFDVVAVAAGLSRSGSTIDRQSLTADKGFRGLTGLFRFRPDGRLERRHELYQVREGQLVPVQEVGTGF